MIDVQQMKLLGVKAVQKNCLELPKEVLRKILAEAGIPFPEGSKLEVPLTFAVGTPFEKDTTVEVGKLIITWTEEA